MNQSDNYKQPIFSALTRLTERGTVGDGPVSFSMRIPTEGALAIVPLASASGAALARASVASMPIGLETEPLKATLTGIHESVYACRPDVGAVAVTQQPWARALAELKEPMPGIFDEQARQLGTCVETLASDGNHPVAHVWAKLRRGGNAFLCGGYAVSLGVTRDKAVFNCELLEKCAKAYVLARLTGKPVRRIPWLVRQIANRRLLKDERRAAKFYARGEVPHGFSAY